MNRISPSILLGSAFAALAFALPGHVGAQPAATPATRPASGGIVAPADHLGRSLGADFTLADNAEVTGYYRRLAEASPNVRFESIGTSAEGRELLVAVISSPANLGHLDQLKAYAHTLADPRGKSPAEKETALRDGKVFLVVTPSMHSNEVAAVQMGMQFSYQLATSDEEPWKSARDNAVIFIMPTLNPDGLEHISTWYRKVVGTPYETAGLPQLYQRYAGHDNNRDWFMMSLPETRVLSKKLYSEWFPQILWDVHQQGTDGERMFVPPYRDPLDPNIDPAIVAEINLLGTRAVLDMTQDGKRGVATGSTYDMWWAGGNRSTPARHNIVGILTEAASANLASPIYLERSALKPPIGDVYGPSVSFVDPWPGGWWRVRDIIDYELSFGRSLLGTINREPRMWRENELHAAERACVAGQAEGVKGWIIPSDNRDPAAVKRLVDALMLAGVEVNVSKDAVSDAGRTYPAGSIVIRRDQPYGGHVKDLFDVQRYPEKTTPYDVAGWTLPLLMGVQRVEAMSPLPDAAALQRVTEPAQAVATFKGTAAPDGTLSTADSSAWTAVAERLKGGEPLQFVTSGPDGGSFLAKGAKARSIDGVDATVINVNKLPRIGVYAPWSGSIDEGWMRYCFDEWKIPYTTVHNEAIRAGELDKFLDVLIIPDVSAKVLDEGRADGTAPEELTEGLSPEGSAAIEAFVRRGGTLITFKSSSKWAAKLFQAPLVDCVETPDDAKALACPGSVLRGIPSDSSALTAGLPEYVPLFFASGTGWKDMPKADREKANLPDVKADVLLHYAPTDLLMSGYVSKSAMLEGQAAWVRLPHGKGAVHLFGFQPQYRSWTQATIPLIFRAALLDEAQRSVDAPTTRPAKSK